MDLKLGILLCKHLSQKFQLIGVDRLLLVRTLQKTARRQLVAARDLRHGGLRFVTAVGAFGYFGIGDS